MHLPPNFILPPCRFSEGINFGLLALGCICLVIHSFSSLAGSLENNSLVCDVAILCLKNAIADIHENVERCNKLAAMIFPLLLVLPKVIFFSFQTSKYSQFCNSCSSWYAVNSVQQFELSIERILLHGLQTLRLNLKALELAKVLKWPLFENLAAACHTEQVSYDFVNARVLLVYISSCFFVSYFFYSECEVSNSEVVTLNVDIKTRKLVLH